MKISQGTISVLFGCHSIVHSILVLISWKKVYKTWPKFWQVVCIFLHDIGHWGLNYLDNKEDKKLHYITGARIAYKLFGYKGYKLVAGHTSSSNCPISNLRLPDKYSWSIAPVIWLWSNQIFEPKLQRPDMAKWESGKYWKKQMKEFIKTDAYKTNSAHDLYLKSWRITGIMDKETGQEIHIWRNRKEENNSSYDQLTDSMVHEAKENGYEPYDLNWKGRPNIYLRGKYEYNDNERGRLIEDGFMMFVKKIR